MREEDILLEIPMIRLLHQRGITYFFINSSTVIKNWDKTFFVKNIEINYSWKQQFLFSRRVVIEMQVFYLLEPSEERANVTYKLCLSQWWTIMFSSK